MYNYLFIISYFRYQQPFAFLGYNKFFFKIAGNRF